MTLAPPPISWPTRENWTTSRQPRHPDGRISQCLSNFATPTEIDNLIRALVQLHATQAGVARRRITEAIKQLRSDTLPHLPEVPAAQQLVEPLRHRRENALELHKQAWSQHRDARAVDDFAWTVELQRRAATESEFAAAWANLTSQVEERGAA
jgi:hypothetical protein